ncbi:MAG: hypothetical protein JWO77_2274 [Ilumatobacteraceae bacterium]|nr:hypothetical protein [Ilumatobacteraceae bacterium]
MPMMRRGPLDRYPTEWVLRQANAHRAEGSIEFNTDRPVTLFFAAGRVYAAERGADLLEADLATRPILTEERAREKAVELLAEIMGVTEGWYFHNPLGHHPRQGSEAWETATLLMDTRSKVHETSSLATWTGRTVSLHESPEASITLGADAWAIVVALARTTAVGTLRGQLGWSPDRLVSALVEIEDRGVLEPSPAAGWRPPPPADPSVGSGPDGHRAGPPDPPPSEDAGMLRRRTRTGRRTAST